MANCVLCRRPNPPNLHKGLCRTCYEEYRSMIRLEEESHRLARLGDAESLDLLGFLRFLKSREQRAYAPIWWRYASIRRLVNQHRLPALASREEWLKWKADLFPSPGPCARAVGHYLAYKGVDLDRRLYRQVWYEQFMAGETPPQVQCVSDRLCGYLREYLADLRTKHGGHSSLDSHGRSLIHFLVWLGQNTVIRELSAILPEHISAYLTAFKTDGMTPGRKLVPGHSKSVSTVARRLGVLRALFAWAMRKQMCIANPVHGWQIDRRNRRTDPLPEEEVAHLLEVWTNPNTPPRAAMVGLMLLVYGLYPSQLVALECKAVDLAKNLFHGLTISVPIPPVLRPVLIRYLEWRAARVDSLQEHNFVISRMRGKYDRPTTAILVKDLRPYRITPRQLRVTALASTIKHGNLKLLSVFGLTADGMKRYQDLSRLADNTRVVTPKPNLW